MEVAVCGLTLAWSERESAVWLRDQSDVSNGCLPSLTLNVGPLACHHMRSLMAKTFPRVNSVPHRRVVPLLVVSLWLAATFCVTACTVFSDSQGNETLEGRNWDMTEAGLGVPVMWVVPAQGSDHVREERGGTASLPSSLAAWRGLFLGQTLDLTGKISGKALGRKETRKTDHAVRRQEPIWEISNRA